MAVTTDTPSLAPTGVRKPPHNGPARGMGWGGPPKGAHDKPRRTAAEARASKAAMAPETLVQRAARHRMMADQLVDRMHEVAMVNDGLLVAATLAFHKVTGQMPPEVLAAAPGTTAAFVLIGAREAATPEEWQAQAQLGAPAEPPEEPTDG